MKKTVFLFCVLALLVLTAYATFALTAEFYLPAVQQGMTPLTTKLSEIETLLDNYYVDEYDPEVIADAAADAAIEATGDQWSYYIPASEYASYEEHVQNAYAGIGVSILPWDGEGFPITAVTEESPADAAGIQVGDKLCRIAGKELTGMEIEEVQSIVKGELGTKIDLTYLHDGKKNDVTLERALITKTVAAGEMLTDKIGCVTITNFDQNSAKQAIKAIEEVLQQGATLLIFDVRQNMGGLRSEMVQILDYLLPEGDIFHGVGYDGTVSVDRSDKNCVSIPMVVLVDKNSFSAAEFFAAVLQEWKWATIVGEQTSGKGNYQYTFTLSDGSAVAISVGKYFTPSGRHLDGDGVTPDVAIELTDEQAIALYYGDLLPEDDPQMQRAIEILTKKIS